MSAAAAPDAETIHATCVALAAGGVLLAGRSGAGKSDLALRLIDRGATLVADDYAAVRAQDGALVATAPATIAGLIEVRGVGIVPMPHAASATIRLLVDLDATPERLPEPATRTIAGVALPLIALAPFEPSAPLKVELALARLDRAT